MTLCAVERNALSDTRQRLFDFANAEWPKAPRDLPESVTLPARPTSFSISALAPWFGSNRTLGPEVGKLLAGASWVGIPFAGGLSEVPHTTARTILVNDLHKALITLARVAADDRLGPLLYRRLRRHALHPDELHHYQDVCLAIEALSDDEPRLDDDDSLLNFAESYFIAVWMARSGIAGTDDELTASASIRWNAKGGDSARRYQNAIRSLNQWRRTLRRATFSTLDVFDFLTKCKDEPRHAIYCDQPFPGPGEKYKHKFTDEQTVELSERLAEFSAARIVCRFYEHPLIRQCYPESIWTWHRYTGRKQTNEPSAELLLVKN